VNASTVNCASSFFVLVIKDQKLSGNLPKEKKERIHVANPRSHSIPNRSRRHRPTLQQDFGRESERPTCYLTGAASETMA
jgi:hypothetical protein